MRIQGKRTAARQNRRCDSPSSALYLWNASHIHGQYLEQAVFDQPAEEFVQVAAQRLGLDVKFCEQFVKGGGDVGFTSDELPHARSGGVQAKITLAFEVQ